MDFKYKPLPKSNVIVINKPPDDPLEVLDIKFYTGCYNDINPRFTKPKLHYEKYGRDENRLPNIEKFRHLYPLFDVEIYKKYNNDLWSLTNLQLLSHFHHKGRFECRKYMIDDGVKIR